MSTRSAGGVRQAPSGGLLEDARACRRAPCPHTRGDCLDHRPCAWRPPAWGLCGAL